MPFKSLGVVSYSPSIATMAISYIVCEIYSDLLVENRAIFIPHLYLAPPQGVTMSEFREDLDIHKTRMNGLSCGEESMTIIIHNVFSRFDTVSACDRQTDGRTDVQPISFIYLLFLSVL